MADNRLIPSMTLRGPNRLAQTPTPADAWESVSGGVGDYVAQQRAQAVADGLLDPNTGMPTVAGMRAAGQAYAGGMTDNGVGGMMGGIKGVPSAAEGNFANWFGKSKVVDGAGKPLVVYHGTDATFDAFDPSHLGKNFDDAASRQGFFFASNKKVAANYGDPIASHVSVQNPLHINAIEELKNDYSPTSGQTFPEFVKGIEQDKQFGGPYGYFEQSLAHHLQDAKSKGHDGLILDFNGLKDSEFGDLGKIVVPFQPTQIKSAFDNNGAYSPTDPSIFRQAAPFIAVGGGAVAANRLAPDSP